MDKINRPVVMVIDDERLLVELVCEGLHDAGIPAISCTESKKAFPSIQRHQPAVVILDVQMPEVDGLKIFRDMRANPETRATPVIFFSGNLDKLKRWLPNYRSLGVELLPKPFDIDRLLAVVQKLIGGSQISSAA
jgi:DNA-binding response OmpR family regulator